MRNIILVLLFIGVTSCASKQYIPVKKEITLADKIIRKAQSYKGTRYLFGGENYHGIDCSGLVFTVFAKERIALPRISRKMANEGFKVTLNKVKKGDLLFFKTSRKNRINHVGIVVSTKNKDIKFIHASTSLGVIESNLSEKYWKKTFAKARRLL